MNEGSLYPVGISQTRTLDTYNAASSVAANHRQILQLIRIADSEYPGDAVAFELERQYAIGFAI